LYARVYLGKTLLEQGKHIEEWRRIEPDLTEEERLMSSPIAFYAEGREDEAHEALEALIDSAVADAFPYTVAQSYAYFDDTERAFRWLEQAYTQRDPSLIEILSDARLFRNIVDDPRYAAFLRKMNLPAPRIAGTNAALEP
jgi:hypothetical protein